MTIYDLHELSITIADKMATETTPELPIQTRDLCINLAITQFLNGVVSGMNVSKTAFESDEGRINQVAHLVKHENLAKIVTAQKIASKRYNTYTYLQPADYFRTISVRLNLTTPVNDENQIEVHTKTHNEINDLLLSPFNLGLIGYRIVKGDNDGIDNQIVVIANKKLAVGTCLLMYIKKPTELKYGVTYTITPGALFWQTLEFEFPEAVAKEIARLSAIQMLISIGDPSVSNITNQLPLS